MALLIEEYKHFVKNDRFMFCVTNVRVFSERPKHNLKDKDMNIFVHKISHFGIQKFSIKFIQREHEGEKKREKVQT